MRRLLFVLAAALMLAVPAAAQYTQEFVGDQVTVEHAEVGAYLSAIHNIPWSFPSLDVVFVWHGYLDATPEQLRLVFDSVYVVNDDGSLRFFTLAPHEWRQGKTFPWFDEMGCYVRFYQDPLRPELLPFELVTVNAGLATAHLFDGRLAFTGSPPIWWDLDPTAWLFDWYVEPFNWPVVGGLVAPPYGATAE